jgi:hypothetical protein
MLYSRNGARKEPLVDTKVKRRLRFMFQEIDLAEGAFLVGRSPSCNLTLEDPLVSRHHARISVGRDRAAISDLGSRNGTLVNGEPLFDDHPLQHNDRIRIGSHEIVFLEERRLPSQQLRVTGALIACPSCRATIMSGAPVCPHCSGQLPRDTKSCPRCRTLCDTASTFCTRCGATFEPGEDTITLHMGGSSSGWTSGMVSTVIEKAIRARRFDHASRLLAGKIEEYDLKAARGVHDIALLAEIVPTNARLAVELREADRLRWIVAAYTRAAEPATDAVLDLLLESARGWYNMTDDLAGYLGALEKSGHREGAVVDRLRSLVRG